MKKICTLLASTFLISACASQTPEFKGKEYQLQNAPENAEITIGFDEKENRFFGKSAVNRYMGTYQTGGNDMMLSLGGSTMMMGPIELMNIETEYLEFLKGVTSYHVDGNKLFLKSNDKELEFKE